MTQDIMQRISYILNDIDSVKEEFEQTIRDRNISLKDRWELFKNSPAFLKDHDSWIIHFTFPDGSKYEVDGHDRHMTKDMVEEVEYLKESELYENHPESNGMENYDEFPDSVNVTAFKEFVLGINLGSFCVDW